MAEKDEKKLSKAQLMSKYYNEMKTKAENPEQVRQGLSKRLKDLDPDVVATLKALMEQTAREELLDKESIEKKYTGGKVGDKYYGGGPVYPRPTKGN